MLLAHASNVIHAARLSNDALQLHHRKGRAHDGHRQRSLTGDLIDVQGFCRQHVEEDSLGFVEGKYVLYGKLPCDTRRR